MSVQKPVFRIVRNGYDRFMVDDAIEGYSSQVNDLQKKVEVYQRQLAELAEQVEIFRRTADARKKDDEAKKRADENIARVSLREANEIVVTARQNADEIIRDALSTAEVILSDLNSLYDQADQMKAQMNEQLDDLQKQLDALKLPEMPDISWLEETKKKLH